MLEDRTRRRQHGARMAVALAAALVLALGGAVRITAPADAAGEPVVQRVAGSDRYATAAAIAERTWPGGADVVYLAVGARFADALAAGPAAARRGAPILLTAATQLPAVTETALERLAPTEVVVLGGAGAISEDVVDDVRSHTGAAVHRIGGADRYETAAAIATSSWPGGADTAYLAAGDRFADALSAGPVAGALDVPVLVTPSDELAAPIRRALDELGVTQVVVAGGPGAVSDEVAAEAGTGRSVVRVAGEDRYATSAALADRLTGSAAQTTYVATGATFADALTAVPAAVEQTAPILLSRRSCLPEPVVEHAVASPSVVLVGGEQALGPGVAQLTPCTMDTSCGHQPGRVFLESQGWWRADDGTDAGHVHIGTCFPVGETISGDVVFDVRVIMHENPGTLTRVQVGVVSGDNSGTEPTAVHPETRCAEGQTCVSWHRLRFDTTAADYDGLAEFRFQARTVLDTGKVLFASTGFPAVLANGAPRVDHRDRLVTVGRGWYTDAGYQNADFRGPVPRSTVSGTWEVDVKLSEGADGRPASRWFVLVDPAFHADEDQFGTVVASGTGEHDGVVDIDTTRLEDGPHRLVLRTDSDQPDGAVHSGLLVIPFDVDNP